MIHPYEVTDRLLYMEFNLKMCTLYNGRPIGPAQIQFEHRRDKSLSFNGIGIFTNGKLHMGPFLCIDGKNNPCLYSMMIDGRPANG